MVNAQGELVQGSTEAGTPCTNERPVQVAGCDTVTGNKVTLPITNNTVPVSGSVTATPSGVQASSVADGSDVTEGSIADAAVTGDNPGTISAKLRGINKILADVWDSLLHRLNVTAFFAFPSNATYSSGGDVLVTTTSVNVGTITSVSYLFHGAGVAKRYEINRIIITFTPGSGSSIRLRIGRITAENGTPGGTAKTPVAHDTADAASAAIFRVGATGAPTRDTNFILSLGLSNTANLIQTIVITQEQFPEGKPLVIRASVAEGWEVTLINNAALTTNASATADFGWTEK